MPDSAQTERPLIDLIIAIDTSTSMREEVVALSHAAETAMAEACVKCPADLRVEWVGLEGTWKETNFTCTLRQYLRLSVT